MDFGLARLVNDELQTKLTQEGMKVGTPSYMSPEQIEGEAELGPASDVFSLGIMLYEMLTMQRPFQGSVVSVIGQILHKSPKPIRELRPDASPQLAAICMKALAKNLDERYVSMKEFADDLGDFLEGKSSEPMAAGADEDESAWGGSAWDEPGTISEEPPADEPAPAAAVAAVEPTMAEDTDPPLVPEFAAEEKSESVPAVASKDKPKAKPMPPERKAPPAPPTGPKPGNPGFRPPPGGPDIDAEMAKFDTDEDGVLAKNELPPFVFSKARYEQRQYGDEERTRNRLQTISRKAAHAAARQRRSAAAAIVTSTAFLAGSPR